MALQTLVGALDTTTQPPTKVTKAKLSRHPAQQKTTRKRNLEEVSACCYEPVETALKSTISSCGTWCNNLVKCRPLC
eukprot:5883855-Pyramimonas_sp.AAC.1